MVPLLIKYIPEQGGDVSTITEDLKNKNRCIDEAIRCMKKEEHWENIGERLTKSIVSSIFRSSNKYPGSFSSRILDSDILFLD
jgi:hypothetical protein